jgi:SAM-dependent methyltransferase
MDVRQHWDRVHAAKPPEELSWYQSVPTVSLRMIDSAGLPGDARLLDVGGGVSTLVDALLERGYSRVSVLDVSAVALTAARARLGDRAGEVEWLEGNILDTPLPPSAFDLWHDRAVFHFLTEAVDRAAYVEAAAQALRPGGHLLVSTFAHDGPERCSGLPVVRYDPQGLESELGERFRGVEHERVEHVTPGGGLQRFLCCRFLRV